MSTDDQEPHLISSIHPEESKSKAEIQVPVEATHHGKSTFAYNDKTGSPNIEQPRFKPFYIPSTHNVHQQQSYEFTPHLQTEEAEERLVNEMADRLEANVYTPCVLGLLSNHDCSSSLGCCSYPVNECTAGQHFIFMVPDPLVEPTGASLRHRSRDGDVSCTPQRLTSNPDLYTVPLDGCGVHRHVAGQTEVHLLEVHGIQVPYDDQSKNDVSPVRLMVECRSSPGSPGKVKFQIMSPSQAPPVQTTPATVTVQLRIATDNSFTKYYPEAHLPLGLIQGRPLYLEVSLLNPPEPGLVLLVHYCLAYTHPPYASWMLIYDGCPSRDDALHLSQPLAPPHTQRLTVTSFSSLPSKINNRGFFQLEDPEIHFLCSTDVCSSADGDCTVGCLSV
ncbi:zona pellucida sperm-binding protein 1-like [Lampris incognitus]|uniref:zona pellucida sperm-binding protein 1-like n=1 Tax=Lampris incognitus TaxID=2546036 RepID=UPI0024B5B86A|nr:zona pellucida sperm-binding protein 1-like [Lampris incognitus]